MRGRQTNPFKRAASQMKRQATRSRNELIYMAMWGESPRKKKKG